jgi:DNA primase
VAQFDQGFVEKVRSAVDIVDIIGRDIKLTQRGKNFVGLCPFHDEKTASFNVSRENQLYYCFGCGSGGNIFNYLMNARHLSFPEAVQTLAEEVGIPLPNISPRQREQAAKAQQLQELNRLAAQYYYRTLRSNLGEQARNYLVQRAIDERLARHFHPAWEWT